MKEKQGIVAFDYSYHTHPFDKGSHDADYKVYGDPDKPSWDDSVIAREHLRIPGIIVSRTRIIVYDGTGNDCKFSR